MGIADILAALIKLGLPLAGLSWLLFHWLYSAGEIARDADQAAIEDNLKETKKSFRKKATRRANYSASGVPISFVTSGCALAVASMGPRPCGLWW